MTDKFVPESVRKRLVVGQRVRYVGDDGDCDLDSTPDSHAGRYKATGHESYAMAEGRTGVIRKANDLRCEGHPYLVRMDKPFEFGRRWWNNVAAAAHELALVED